jgi:hypothetical protein
MLLTTLAALRVYAYSPGYTLHTALGAFSPGYTLHTALGAFSPGYTPTHCTWSLLTWGQFPFYL